MAGISSASAALHIYSGPTITSTPNSATAGIVYWNWDFNSPNSLTIGAKSVTGGFASQTFGFMYAATNYIYTGKSGTLGVQTAGWAVTGAAGEPDARLSSGTTIDSSTTWSATGSAFTYFRRPSWTESSDHPWATGQDNTQGYVAFRLGNAAQVQDVTDWYYGWAAITYNDASNQLLVTSYAWNDVAGTPVVTGAIPEPGSLGLLALGAAGVACMRRRKAA